VKSCVKYGHLGDRRQELFDYLNPIQAGRIVEWRELTEFIYHTLDLGRDPYRLREPAATMNNPMGNCANVINASQRGRRPGYQILENSRDRVSMFSELKLLSNLGLPRTTEKQPRWLSGPVDSAFCQQHLRVSLKKAEFEAAGTRVADKDFHFPIGFLTRFKEIMRIVISTPILLQLLKSDLARIGVPSHGEKIQPTE